MSEIEKVGPGKFVAYSYKLYNDADGQLLFETPADAPDVMVYGVSQEVIPGLIAAVKDLKRVINLAQRCRLPLPLASISLIM